MHHLKIIRLPYQARKSVWYVVSEGRFIGGPFLRKDEATAFAKART